MRILVNDEPREIAADTVLSQLMAEFALRTFDGVAVAVNEVVVARADWEAHALSEGDRLLVIRATQGG
ncbi:MAG: sulfur carrier protein ThiS [Puniceicoccales bacterium]|jgi:sulfur carrier protein|nr:sulfur carrier protein ThiS [Puniceicoccales bacterium]